MTCVMRIAISQACHDFMADQQLSRLPDVVNTAGQLQPEATHVALVWIKLIAQSLHFWVAMFWLQGGAQTVLVCQLGPGSQRAHNKNG